MLAYLIGPYDRDMMDITVSSCSHERLRRVLVRGGAIGCVEEQHVERIHSFQEFDRMQIAHFFASTR